MKCPYCQNDNMPKPPSSPRPFGRCPNCGKKSRAAVSFGKDGEMYAHYSATSLPKLDASSVKQTLSIRLSQRDIQIIESGLAHIVVRNNRLRLQYKP